MIKKKYVLLYCTIFLTLFLSSCWDMEELVDIALVLAIGIDYLNEEEFEISVEVELPGSVPSGPNATGDSQATFLQSSKGKTISDAMANLQQSFARRLFISHNRAIVFGEEYARKIGVSDELEYINRFPESRLRSRVYVSNTTAKEILTTVNHLRDSTAETLNKLSGTGITHRTTVKDILIDLNSKDRDIYIPIIALSPEKEGSVEGKENIKHIGTAIFDKNRMIDKLEIPLTRGLLWIQNEIELATVTFQPKEADSGYISSLMIRAHTKLIPSIKDGKWKITIQSVSEDDIVQNTTKLKLTDIKNIESIEDQLEEEVINKMKDTVEKIQQEIKSDVFGFGRAFYEKYPKEWQKHSEDWNSFFPQVEVEYDVKVHVRRIGLAD